MRSFIALTGAFVMDEAKSAGEPLRGTRGLRQAVHGWREQPLARHTDVGFTAGRLRHRRDFETAA